MSAPTLLGRPAQDLVDRLRVDLTALRQRIRELDRRVTALQLLSAADDGRHIEQAIMDTAAAATDLHKVNELLGGRGLIDRLHERVVALGDLDCAQSLDTLVAEIDDTRARVERSSLLATASSRQLERQIAAILGRPAQSGEYTASPTLPGSDDGASPRIVDRMA